MPQHYIYMHVDPLRGKPFLIGKGSGKRAWDFRNRHKISNRRCVLPMVVNRGRLRYPRVHMTLWDAIDQLRQWVKEQFSEEGK